MAHLKSVEIKSILPVICTEETFGSVGFESIFTHLEIMSNGSLIKVRNDNIDISKSNSYSEPKISPEGCKIALICIPRHHTDLLL